MNIMIIHGQKLSKKGSISKEFTNRLDTALKYLHTVDDINLVLLTGGSTRANFPSEALVGTQYLSERIKVETMLEDKSRTTLENILFSKKLLEDSPVEKIVVITNSRYRSRFRFLYKKLWPEVADIQFVDALDEQSIAKDIREVLAFVYTKLALNFPRIIRPV